MRLVFFSSHRSLFWYLPIRKMARENSEGNESDTRCVTHLSTPTTRGTLPGAYVVVCRVSRQDTILDLRRL